MNTTVQRTPEHAWRFPGLLFALLLAWTLFWFQETAIGIVTIWIRSDTFTHGFLVIPVVAWLVWHKRSTLSHLRPSPNAWFLIPMAAVGLAWLLGDLVAVNVVTQLALVCMMVLLVPTLLGWTVARVVLFAMAFLFFAVPWGDFVIPHFMAWTARFTVLALQWTGVPVYSEGLRFIIPSGSWSVVEACSGVRYLIASLTVGTLFAYITYQSLWRRVVFVGVSIIVPIVANWMRAYLIVMIGHLFGTEHAVGIDHLIYGWLFFGVVILLMFLIGAHWAEPEPAVSAQEMDALQKPWNLRTSASPGRWVAITVAAACVTAAPFLARLALTPAPSAPPVLTAPSALSPTWSAVQNATPSFKPAFQNPSAECNATYASGNQRVNVYVGYYRHQNYDRKLVSSNNVLVQSKDPHWAQVQSGFHNMEWGNEPIRVRTAELRGLGSMASEDRWTVWQVYWVNGTFTASDALAKVYGAIYRLLGRGDDSAVIVLSTPKGQAQEGADRLQAFVQANAASLTTLLQHTRGER